MANLKPRLQSGAAEGVDAGRAAQAARNRVYAGLSDAELYALTEADAAAASDQVLTAEQAEALDKFWAAVGAGCPLTW
jgi:hypothetical protein